MANTRLVSAIVAAGVIAAGVTTSYAWADGPAGPANNPQDIYEAVGTGTFIGELDGFRATGVSAEEASAAVIGLCQAAGGVDCTADEVSNDNVCIVSVADDITDVVAGGAGLTVELAQADANARAAANGTPLGADQAVVISACP